MKRRLFLRLRMSYWGLVSLAVVGCGSSGSPFEYVPVSGTVVYEDGSSFPGRPQLYFTSLDAEAVGNSRPREAVTQVGADGKFDVVTSYKYGDGLIPGRHKVVLAGDKKLAPQECFEVSTTPIIVDTADSPLVVRVPKP